jgi:hypothetical protein
MGKTNSKDKLLELMRGDREQEIRSLLQTSPELKDSYVNKNDDHSALCMAAYFGSLVSVKVLLEVNIITKLLAGK